MLRKGFLKVTTFIVFLFVSSTFTLAQQNKIHLETIVHLLSYVAMDYSGAVEKGEIINQGEYDEQIEFSEHAFVLIEENISISEKEELLVSTKDLITAIENKVDAEEIKKLANSIKNRIIEVTGLVTAPKSWPNLENGKRLYASTCALCHGIKGDGEGEGAKGLDPEPSNFFDEDLMSHFSPYQAFNAIKLGVPGTAMTAYESVYDDEDIWDLAFFITSFRYQENLKDSTVLQSNFNSLYSSIDLKDVATMGDDDLLLKLKAFGGDYESNLIALRLLAPSVDATANTLVFAKKKLDEAFVFYREGNKKMARTVALTAYLEGIEPVEARIKANDSKFVAKIENAMFAVRQAIEKDLGEEIVAERIASAKEVIDEADQLMKGNKLSYWLTFVIAASIFLREGLEAFLIIAIVIALIRNANGNAKKALLWLHSGWVLAILMGIGGWFLSDLILQFGGRNREVMEGLISIFAVIILLWAGFWLHSKTEAKKWTDFITNKIGVYLQGEKMMGLAAFSFMIVFREVFEVILFLQAINLEALPDQKSAILLGVVVAAVAIVIIAFIFLNYSKKIPVRQLFLYSTWIIVLLAIILVGKGVHSLQESGWISVTSLGNLRVEWLGIYPSVQTILSQIGVFIFVLLMFYIRGKRNQKEIN